MPRQALDLAVIDRRPTLAGQFVDAILADIGGESVVDSPETRERWCKLILDRFRSSSIPFPSLDEQSYQPGLVNLFLEKYPGLEAVIEYIRLASREVWPDARLLLSLRGDPESCHTCTEGQMICIEIFSQIGDRESESDHVREFREGRFSDLMFDETSLYSTTPLRNLLTYWRQPGDPDQKVADSEQALADWEVLRRERAGRKAAVDVP